MKTLYIQNNFVKQPTFKFTIPKKLTRNESELKYYRQYHPYLTQRGISENTANIYDIGFDSVNNQITFPIRDKDKNCLGIGRRDIYKKMYRYPEGMVKPLYGVYELPRHINYLYIVEGPFNLWSLYEYSQPGVALLGTGTGNQYKQLLDIQCNGYILALDPDDAGRKGINKLSNFLYQNNKTNILVPELPENKDINDLVPQEFFNLNYITINEWKNKYKYLLQTN